MLQRTLISVCVVLTVGTVIMSCSDKGPEPVLVPAAPSSLKAVATSQVAVALTWADNSSNESGFCIERALGNAPGFEEIGRAGSNETSFTDDGLTPSARYRYRVKAYNRDGESAYCDEAAATTLSVLPGPKDLTATALSSTSIRLCWTDNTEDRTGFAVERRVENEEEFERIAVVPSNTTCYEDAGLSPATEYSYRVAVICPEQTGWSAEVVTARTRPLPPAAPSNMVAIRTAELALHLSWTDNSDNESGFEILCRNTLRQPGQDPRWVRAKVVEAGLEECDLEGFVFQSSYDSVAVRAVNDGGSSDLSNKVGICPWAAPDAPSDLSARALSRGTRPLVDYDVALRWSDNSDCETGFRIYRANQDPVVDKYGDFIPLAIEIARDAAGARDDDVYLGRKYKYRVVALNAFGESTFSDEFEITVE